MEIEHEVLCLTKLAVGTDDYHIPEPNYCAFTSPEDFGGLAIYVADSILPKDYLGGSVNFLTPEQRKTESVVNSVQLEYTGQVNYYWPRTMFMDPLIGPLLFGRGLNVLRLLIFTDSKSVAPFSLTPTSSAGIRLNEVITPVLHYDEPGYSSLTKSPMMVRNFLTEIYGRFNVLHDEFLPPPVIGVDTQTYSTPPGIGINIESGIGGMYKVPFSGVLDLTGIYSNYGRDLVSGLIYYAFIMEDRATTISDEPLSESVKYYPECRFSYNYLYKV